MSNTSDSASTVELQTEVQSFLSTGVDLKRLLRDVSKQSKSAVEALAGLLTNQDPKIQLAAAKALLDLNVNVASAINDDNLKRLIAEVRLNPSGTRRLVAADEDNSPLVDFSTIRSVE